MKKKQPRLQSKNLNNASSGSSHSVVLFIIIILLALLAIYVFFTHENQKYQAPDKKIDSVKNNTEETRKDQIQKPKDQTAEEKAEEKIPHKEPAPSETSQNARKKISETQEDKPTPAEDAPHATQLQAKILWIGNSYIANPEWVQHNIADMFVTQDGYIYTNVVWEEGGGNVACYDKDGNWLNVARHTRGWGYEGGDAVCVNSKYLFFAQYVENEGGGLLDPSTWPPKGSEWIGISRRMRNSITDGAPFKDGKGGKGDTIPGSFKVLAEFSNKREAIRGLASSETHLYASLQLASQIVLLDTENMSEIRRIKFPNIHRISLDPTGKTLWALQSPINNKSRWNLLALKTSSCQQITKYELPKDWLPAGLSCAPDGKLLVTDSANHQIHIFKVEAGYNPRFSHSIGVKNGIFAQPAPGEKGLLRFNNPVAAGMDKEQNIYIASNGSCNGSGTIIESYDKDGNLRWQRFGSIFVDVVDINPEDMKVYSVEEIFSLHPECKTGEHWSYNAFTFDKIKFPDDIRGRDWINNAWFRKLQGKPFLFMTGMSKPFMAVYRFDEEKAGYIAIPCALFSRNNLGEWPKNAPKDRGFRWIDLNADGHMQENEFFLNDRDGNNIQGIFPMQIDHNGNLSWGFRDEIRIYRFAGLSPQNIPSWNWDEPVIFNKPDEFDEMRRCVHSAENNILAIAGNKYKNRNQHWKPMGPVLSIYENVLNGETKLRWTRVLPFTEGSHGHESSEPIGMDIAGDYIFVAYTRGLREEGIKNAFVKVFHINNGAFVGNLICEHITGDIGLLDLEHPLTARKLPNGSYIVFLEDDWKAKNVIFLWKPTE